MTLAQTVSGMLTAGLDSHGVPGAAVGLWHDGVETIVVDGITSVDTGVPVTERTLFHTGSTTKTHTATAVMRLVERGALDLDAPVRTYVPELTMADEEVAQRLTLRHLLTHTGGHDGDLFDAFGGGDDCLSRFAAGLDRLPQLAPLGTWTYSNAGFSVAGRVIEVVTGRVFEDALADLVLEPLGLVDSVFGAEASITRPFAVGHRPGPGGPTVTEPWGLPRTAHPAGGLSASIRDQLAWARFNLGDGAPLLSPESMQLMQAPLVPAGGGRAAHCGLAWLLQPTPGVVAHGGSINGQESAFVLVPERAFAIAVATNSSSGSGLHRQLVKWALREVAGVAPFHRELTPVTTAALPEYEGVYHSLHETLTVRRANGGLVLAIEPTPVALQHFPDERSSLDMTFEVYGEDRVRVGDGDYAGARGEFVRGEGGTVRWLRMLGRLHARCG